MSELSEAFQKKWDSVKLKMLAMTVAGASFLTPMNSFSHENSKEDNTSVKTELVTQKQAITNDSISIFQTDSLAQNQTIAKDSTSTIHFEDARLQKAADKMIKTPTGAKVLNELSKLGIDAKIDDSIAEDLGGAYFQGKKAILIRSSCSDALIASILIHEGTHAIQAARGCKLTPGLDAQSYFNLNKAMEADAMKNQVMAAYELKLQGDASVYNAFKTEHRSYCNDYETLYDSCKNNTDSLQRGTFFNYYKDKNYIKTYENRYLEALQTFEKASKKGNVAGCFQIHLSENDIINKACCFDGETYMQPGDSTILASSQCNFIQKSTYKYLQSIAKDFDKKVANDFIAKQDHSFENFYVVDLKGNVKQEPTNLATKTETIAKNDSISTLSLYVNKQFAR